VGGEGKTASLCRGTNLQEVNLKWAARSLGRFDVDLIVRRFHNQYHRFHAMFAAFGIELRLQEELSEEATQNLVTPNPKGITAQELPISVFPPAG
jgi:hypothetical protein